MQEIKCPNCGEVFQVDETGYAKIVQQVRDREFEKELQRREKEQAEKQESQLQLLRLQEERARDAALQEKQAALAELEQRLQQLQARLDGSELERKLAVTEAVQSREQALHEKQMEIAGLLGQLESREKEAQLTERALREQYENELKRKEEQIEYYRDFKARQSTKMVGESLEQHCQNEFNRVRMMSFPNAYFEKDNDARSGSKGDFIFREQTPEGVELLSIMFEMKNEMETTATKHKNEDFFRELDKDRREKGCEYAVLVSLLEGDSEYYNSGIVDVSYRYEKMYVIRPQFFVPLIGLLRNAALNALRYRQELQQMREQQVDISNFEENLEIFKTGFSKNYELASRKFSDAIGEIDKSISHLQKIKDNLLSSERQLRLANDKADGLSIKKLTRNAPSVRELFEQK